VTISPEVVSELCDDPNIVGIKDSSASLRSFGRLTAAIDTDAFTIVTGSDGLLFHTLVSGGDGCVSPGANVVPDWFVSLWDVFREGNWSGAWAIQERIEVMHRGIGYGTFPAGIKAALSIMGIGSRRLAEPSAAVTDEQLVAIEVSLRDLGIA
jgi:4-hydroxy-tetrahydrodipicolinate synthase